MSLEALNHIEPRGLLSLQLKVLGLLDHLSCTLKKNLSSMIHFTYFCGLGYHPQVNIYICETLGIGVIRLPWTWGMFWMLLSVRCCGKWILSRTCTYWAQEQSRWSLCHRLTPGWNLGLWDWRCADTESWLWRPLYSLTPSLSKHPFIISSVTASNKNKRSVIYAVSFSPGAVPWYRI